MRAERTKIIRLIQWAICLDVAGQFWSIDSISFLSSRYSIRYRCTMGDSRPDTCPRIEFMVVKWKGTQSRNTLLMLSFFSLSVSVSLVEWIWLNARVKLRAHYACQGWLRRCSVISFLPFGDLMNSFVILSFLVAGKQLAWQQSKEIMPESFSPVLLISFVVVVVVTEARLACV